MDINFTRGHECYFDEASKSWKYSDNNEPVENNERPCKRCGKMPTKDGHDACLGNIPGVKHACCGHGELEPYFIYN